MKNGGLKLWARLIACDLYSSTINHSLTPSVVSASRSFAQMPSSIKIKWCPWSLCALSDSSQTRPRSCGKYSANFARSQISREWEQLLCYWKGEEGMRRELPCHAQESGCRSLCYIPPWSLLVAVHLHLWRALIRWQWLDELLSLLCPLFLQHDTIALLSPVAWHHTWEEWPAEILIPQVKLFLMWRKYRHEALKFTGDTAVRSSSRHHAEFCSIDMCFALIK